MQNNKFGCLWFHDKRFQLLYFQGNIEYYSDEVEINAKFRLFAKNSSTVFAGHNTVSAQMKFRSKRGIQIIAWYHAINKLIG